MIFFNLFLFTQIWVISHRLRDSDSDCKQLETVTHMPGTFFFFTLPLIHFIQEACHICTDASLILLRGDCRRWLVVRLEVGVH